MPAPPERSWIAVLIIVVLSTAPLHAQDGVQPFRFACLIPIVDLVLTAVLATGAVCIAFQQMRIHRQRVASEKRDRELQRQRDLFDRRWEVYAGVLAYLDKIVEAHRPEAIDEAANDIEWPMRRSYFLFEPDVDEYFEELVRRGLVLREDLQDAGADRTGNLIWFIDQYAETQKMFDRYLRLSK